MSDDSVIRRINRNCVPVAVNLYEVRKAKDAGGDFFRALQKHTPEQYQGVYIASAEGKLLAANGKSYDKPALWTQAINKTIDDAMAA